MKIDFVSDVACPWCAVGLWSLDRALERLGDTVDVELHFQPFELNPALPAEGEDTAEYIARKYGASAEQVAKNRAVIRERGAAVGFAFGDRPRIWNTFDAHRLLHWAGLQTGEAQSKLKHALLTAYHARAENPGARDVLLRAAGESGPRRRARRRDPRFRRVRRRGARARAPLAAARHPLGSGRDHRRPPPDLGRPAPGSLRTRVARARRGRLTETRC
jgi:predicted DsbA family dithiol-disulfide isomerase